MPGLAKLRSLKEMIVNNLNLKWAVHVIDLICMSQYYVMCPAVIGLCGSLNNFFVKL